MAYSTLVPTRSPSFLPGDSPIEIDARRRPVSIRRGGPCRFSRARDCTRMARRIKSFAVGLVEENSTLMPCWRISCLIRTRAIVPPPQSQGGQALINPTSTFNVEPWHIPLGPTNSWPRKTKSATLIFGSLDFAHAFRQQCAPHRTAQASYAATCAAASSASHVGAKSSLSPIGAHRRIVMSYSTTINGGPQPRLPAGAGSTLPSFGKSLLKYVRTIDTLSCPHSQSSQAT